MGLDRQVKINNNGKISGLVFGDYYWIPFNHNSELKGKNGFWIRRAYFTYDQNLSNFFSARFRLEMNSEGDLDTNDKLYPHVKDAYLKWKHTDQQILVGISPTPTYSFVRSVWGYRSVEKTPLNLQKMASARNLGITFKGKLGNKDKWGYSIMIANGSGNKTELDKGKKIMLSFSYDISERITIQAYGGWNHKSNEKNIYTGQGFLAYQTNELNIGILYAHQIQQDLPGNDLDIDITSIFSNFKLKKKVRGLLRIDHLFGTNPVGENIDYIPLSSKAKSTFLIIGLDFMLDPKVHLIPNIETVLYGQSHSGIEPTTDLISKLTLYYNF